jgi:hypothetical protein
VVRLRVPGVLVAAVVAGGLAACGGGTSVSDYCSYGAVSQAQLEGCIEHVDQDYINRLDTNAARYARGELDRCLADSGPFCEGR